MKQSKKEHISFSILLMIASFGLAAIKVEQLGSSKTLENVNHTFAKVLI